MVYSSKNYDGTYKLRKRVTSGTAATIAVPRTGGLSYYFVCPYVKVGKFYFYGYDSQILGNFAISVPSGVKGEKISADSYRIKWKPVANAQAYAVFTSSNKNSGYAPLVDENEDPAIFAGTTATVSGMSNVSNDVYFRVTALRSDGGEYVSMSALSKPVQYAHPKYRALLIGNTYPGTINALPGPDNDIAAMETMLKRQSGTPFTVTKKLNVTASSIHSAINTAFAGADSNDVSLFYYSGHGLYSSSSKYLGALCGTSNTYVTVNDLRAWLDKIPGKKIVLLDSCHSGNYIGKSVNGETIDPEEAFNDSVIEAFATETRANLANSSYYVLTACSKKQMSVSKNDSGFYFGLFTDGVTKGSGYDMVAKKNCSWYADSNSNGAITLGEAYNYIVANVNSRGGSQSTKYYGPTSTVLWKQ